MKTRNILIATIAFPLSIFSQDYQKIELLTYGGLPKLETKGLDIDILYNTAYITGYSNELKNPLWTVYRYGNMKGEFDDSRDPKWERPREFKVDRRTQARVSHDDYTSSGYDRGHMAPNSGIWVQYGQMAQLETYYMSNICPPPLVHERIRAPAGGNSCFLSTVDSFPFSLR